MATVVWNSDRTRGVKTTKYAIITVFSTREAVRQHIQQSFVRCVEKPETKGKTSHFYTLNVAEPGIAHVFQKMMLDELETLIPQWIAEWQQKIRKIPEEKQTNTEFLGAMTRDYRKGCAVCLTDKIMGTTCGCGHTEIAVFRPCGHAMCVNPCFENWMKTNTVIFDPEETVIDGKRFTIPGKRKLSTFPPERFSCPECRTLIRSVFRAEDIDSPENLPWNDWVDILVADVGFGFWPTFDT